LASESLAFDELIRLKHHFISTTPYRRTGVLENFISI